jgi:hypothetical protein
MVLGAQLGPGAQGTRGEVGERYRKRLRVELFGRAERGTRRPVEDRVEPAESALPVRLCARITSCCGLAPTR